ncbi:hypothetical protein BGW37DRAFT_485949 [Umbelopsis sp. PMI_123]|nr:hypothetical protein BGW37DRAFT_485949 [Umbelopsis sp. PMI_123]
MAPSSPRPSNDHNQETTKNSSTPVENNSQVSAPHKKRKHTAQDTSKSTAISKAISVATVYPPTPSPDMTGNNIREHIPVIALPPGMSSDKQSQTPPSSPPRASSEGSQSPKQQKQQHHIPDMSLTSTSQPAAFNPQISVQPHVFIAGHPHAIYYHPQNAYYPPTSLDLGASQKNEDGKGKASEDENNQGSDDEKRGSEDSSGKVSGPPQMVSGVPHNMPTFAYLHGQPYSYPTYMMPNGSMSSFPVVPQMSPPLHPAITATPITRQETTADQREQLRKVSHSAIERRRREKINTKIQQLRQLIPSCADQDHLHKLNILQSAIEYINYLHAVLGNMESQGQNVLESAARTDHRMLALLQHLKRLSPSLPTNQESNVVQPAVMFHHENYTTIATAKRKRSDEMDEKETAQQGLLMLSQACASDDHSSAETKHTDMKVNSLLCDR